MHESNGDPRLGRPGSYFERQRAFVKHVLPHVNGAAVRVWDVLQNRARNDKQVKNPDERGLVWPAITTIASDIGGDKDTARAGLRELEEHGVLRPVAKAGEEHKAETRQLLVHAAASGGRKNPPQGSEKPTPEVGKTHPRGRKNPPEPTTTLRKRTSTTNHPEPARRPGSGGGAAVAEGGKAKISHRGRVKLDRPSRDEAAAAVEKLYQSLTDACGNVLRGGEPQEPRYEKQRDELRRLISKNPGMTKKLIEERERQSREGFDSPFGIGFAIKVLRGQAELKTFEEEPVGDDDREKKLRQDPEYQKRMDVFDRLFESVEEEELVWAKDACSSLYYRDPPERIVPGDSIVDDDEIDELLRDGHVLLADEKTVLPRAIAERRGLSFE